MEPALTSVLPVLETPFDGIRAANGVSIGIGRRNCSGCGYAKVFMWVVNWPGQA
ncbi:hypothetical protein L2725_16185 [Shewanella corallii]|uniref:Uncharacterized protein n=1 Tax=Shewanella corallii TaxID=560080 RepID=A0ABT0NBU8_9GAMM|nr:hypothetical protein [Shewanella corallii]MCL2915301.1 hypothetical protein [Shewanella corallii]